MDRTNDRVDTWRFIRQAPAGTGDETTGTATAAVTPWPHQIEAFLRMYRNWPPRLLIADEVGLGKTVQAGMLLRQAWLAGKARRVLVMAPPPVLRQWQRELREKFNLDVPVYESGRLSWLPAPWRASERPVPDDAWHREPFVLASSHLMRRPERRRQILEDAEPWDVVVLDEAHHARRSGGAGTGKDEPNQLLRLMRGIRDRGKAKGLILLTATPMQVDPVEVWDLLSLLGLPEAWTPDAFLEFHGHASDPVPTPSGLRMMARLAAAMERATGRTLGIDDVMALDPERNRFRANKIIKAIRSESSLPVAMLRDEERVLARRLLKAMSPARVLISRHTRELLRRYRSEGALASNIATRMVDDVAIGMTDAERAVYGAVEDYISTTYAKASAKERAAVGFVMTVYHRRLASSFHALTCTLERRLDRVGRRAAGQAEEDLPDDETDEGIDPAEADDRMRRAEAAEEQAEIRLLLEAARRLPLDGKARLLLDVLDRLRADGYRQAVVFTQFTDTLDDLRDLLTKRYGEGSVLCFSGRGGEKRVPSGWEGITRERTKAMFRDGKADILLCTDAAAEGLNFQFCGALVNYDMPWNPMRVEQRIGRIDRLGQAFDVIRIVNLMYRDTIEYDVYCRLRARIDLFRAFVGRLQPILSRLPKTFKELAMTAGDDREAALKAVEAGIDREIEEAEAEGFDLDDDDVRLDVPETAAPAYDLAFLRRVLEDPARRPAGCRVERLGGRDYAYTAPDGRGPVRITTDPAYYEEHAESCELWSPGASTFPW